MSQQTILVPPSAAGERIDRFLFHSSLAHSRAAVQRWIEQGAVRLNGAPVLKASLKLKGGEVLEVDSSDQDLQREPQLEPWNYPLRILYEDETLLAIEKPAGIITHPGAGALQKTIVHALIFLRPELSRVGHPLRPGIVHRLDKETSGVLLVGKTEAAYHALTGLFKDRKISKHYRAFAFGTFRQRTGRIEKPLGRDPQDRKKISVRARRSRSAITVYKVMKQFEFAALLDVEILTGRTHQIRVHLSSENHPIVGDGRYGGGNWLRIPDAALRARLKQGQFFGLHAFSLDFVHPFLQQPLHVESPLPDSWPV